MRIDGIRPLQRIRITMQIVLIFNLIIPTFFAPLRSIETIGLRSAIGQDTENLPRAGGGMKYGELTRSQSQTYDPITRSTSLALRLCELTFDGLLSFDQGNEPIWKLAEGEPQESNNMEYIFTLRQDVKWHDNEPVTAYDVLFTYYAMKNSADCQEQVDFVASVRVENEYTVKFILKAPILNALGKLSFKIIPYHCFGINDPREITEDNPACRVTTQSEFTAKPIGSGPYKFSRVSTSQVDLVAAEPYNCLDRSPRRAYLDHITMRTFNDENTQTSAFLWQGIELIVQLNPNDWQKIYAAARDAKRIIWKADYKSLSYYFFAINQNHPFLGGDENIDVRKALNYATNRELWLDNIEKGSGLLIGGPFPHDSPHRNPKVKPYPYDPQTAKMLLRQSGFVDEDNDGILEKDGKDFILTLRQVAGNQTFSKICEAFCNDLKKVGIKVTTTDAVDMREEVFNQKVRYEHDFDVAFYDWKYSVAAGIYELFHSSQSFPGGKNFISYSNSGIDVNLDRTKKELNPTRLKNLNQMLDEMLHDECPYVWLWTPTRIAVGDGSIRNHDINSSFFFTYITDWWIE